MLMTIPTTSSSSFLPYQCHHVKPKPGGVLLPAFTATSPSSSSSSSNSTTTTTTSPPHFNTVKIISTTTRRRRRWAVSSSSSSGNQTLGIAPTTTLSSPPASASEIVKKFYEGINGHDLASVEDLIADNCVYEDLIFPQPFVGRKAILEFFQKFIDSISTDLQFVIDDISDKDTSVVGVTWHLEWKGKAFPFSKGCSFYRLDVLNGKKQIILKYFHIIWRLITTFKNSYGRDSVEPAIKPGEMALVCTIALIHDINLYKSRMHIYTTQQHLYT
ncbi:uncharacterized protein LOC114266887 isoform X1 [Camellia sinensis]|uniref:uncharacterized protein LOC114266887 isoform X1 n=1 Tax=Camellia sinensis TaxID=4442 RepID=UPI0010358668|nr:uncharacterized protein LOC114266887 isoform X1 [Camellia sinensis]